MDMRPHLRPATAADEPFLLELYARTREPELAAWGWSPAQQQAFLRLQWVAQQRGYAARFSAEGHCIIELGERPVGRLWVARGEQELRLVDIALLPEHRGLGVGTELLRALQQEAAAAGKPLRLSVARDSPALRLYTRLGFTPVGEAGTEAASPYVAMEWRAPAPHPTADVT